jgi:hypothetical protein
MALLVVGLAVAGWVVLDAMLVGVLILVGRRRERRVRALAASVVTTAECLTREAAAPAASATGLAGGHPLRDPTS